MGGLNEEEAGRVYLPPEYVESSKRLRPDPVQQIVPKDGDESEGGDRLNGQADQ